MTTLATEGGGSEVINARRTESLDAPHILQLVQPWTEQLFGRVNVVDIMLVSNFCYICSVNVYGAKCSKVCFVFM